MNIQLIANIQGLSLGYLFEPDKEVTIGREIGNSIAPLVDSISRKHARIICKDGVWTLEDLGSTNGSYLNGTKIEAPSPLKTGDVMRFGMMSLSVELKAPTAASEAPAAPAHPSPSPAVAPAAAPAAELEPVADLPPVEPLKPVSPLTPAEAASAGAAAAPKEILTPTSPTVVAKAPALKPGIKLPPKPALGAGIKLPPRPAGLKPGIKLPPRPAGLKPGIKLPPKNV